MAVIGVIAIVGIIAAIAASAEPPPSFDGWVAMPVDQPLKLRYDRDVQRTVRLRNLRPSDLVGLRDTIVDDVDGNVVRIRAAPTAGPGS